MPEGLSASEAAEELHRHRHHVMGHGESHVGSLIPVLEAVLLSVVTIVTAWAGYSAAKWSTDSRLQLAEASSLRSESNRALATAQENRNFDASTFNAWFIAFTLDDPEKMRIAEGRFRPEFAVAFDAWRATNPETNPDAPPGPTFMPEYVEPEKARAARLDHRAEATARDGERSGSVADNYVRITVILAAVLFLVGIGTTFLARRIRYGIVVVGGLLLVTALVLIVQQPVPG